jgi:hypothetical protein
MSSSLTRKLFNGALTNNTSGSTIPTNVTLTGINTGVPAQTNIWYSPNTILTQPTIISGSTGYVSSYIAPPSNTDITYSLGQFYRENFLDTKSLPSLLLFLGTLQRLFNNHIHKNNYGLYLGRSEQRQVYFNFSKNLAELGPVKASCRVGIGFLNSYLFDLEIRVNYRNSIQMKTSLQGRGALNSIKASHRIQNIVDLYEVYFNKIYS